MKLPTACYRLQLRQGMNFDRAAELAPYLAELGVSHLYTSPLFTAEPGSSHGYDVTDPGEIDPQLGGREGLERLSQVLKAHGLGLILDIVPNHMAFSVATPWLRDILRHGASSRYTGISISTQPPRASACPGSRRPSRRYCEIPGLEWRTTRTVRSS